MTDRECVAFLQWALPKMHMHWPGFRKVRGQVGKRISRRIRVLGLTDIGDYRSLLEASADEWVVLASLCRITISRFFRDRGVFDYLSRAALPSLGNPRDTEIALWSAGCASGEEAYSVKILWEHLPKSLVENKTLRLLGTDADPNMLNRARSALYPKSALREVPSELLETVFKKEANLYRLKPRFRDGLDFKDSDIRTAMPEGPFDLILCRNLVFTYFEPALQAQILEDLLCRLRDDAYLIIGIHESLPETDPNLTPEAPAVYRFSRSA